MVQAKEVDPLQVRVFIPFTHLRCETYLAAPDAVLCPLPDHQNGYADYFLDRWREGQAFINLEQDVVPMKGVLQTMWDCPEYYCVTNYGYPWAESPIHVSPIGCAKFSAGFIAVHHQIFMKGLHWHMPQHQIINATLNKFHLHDPPSLHLHVAEDWPLDARRRYE